MQPYYGPPASSIPMQPLSSGSSRLLGTASGFMQPTASMASAPMQHMAGATRGGGILARLLGGGRLTSLGTSAASGGFNFATILENTQRVMGITQQVAPMVQQYGPFIKNVPTLWRMMRTMRQTPTNETSAAPLEVASAPVQHVPEPVATHESQPSASPAAITPRPVRRQRPETQGASLPKLYI
ncbi:VrrA/YqfQ family protein [Shouchella hunanensis]|uniref:VrrA/YqfQ family protein n=1 Tax=Shouchella hunanensis TaxID=766894 RepID=A0ABY7W3A5_9BACI|nr:VrrA/YqfQ family protein [Shouchella hunanensis]WDF03051.1 VrrA/YqfQ family protein [Shouchella hunanensis]GAF24644.1 hypothetical protein JCM19047_4563 [Bacillus sp. JCM 19047]